MSLLTLIKKGGLADVVTMTPATIATVENNQTNTVAAVATVAVTDRLEAASDSLSTDEEIRILAWLAHINETNQETIDVIVSKCRTDVKTRLYFLQRSEEVGKKDGAFATSATFATCENCKHFERISHPHLGHCRQGEPEAPAGLWDNDRRYCQKYSAMLNQKQN